MKVFISWSGDRSKAVAEALRRWFPSVLQAVRPYFSPDDIAKGARWSPEISKELEASRVGLLIVTPENQEAAWLLFEAGALAKNLERSKVCPLLFGEMEPTDVKGPLVQFQAAQFSKDEMKRVVKMMNTELGDSGLAHDVLDGVFDMWWPRLDTQIQDILKVDNAPEGEARRSDRELLEEVLGLTRRLSADRERRMEFDHPVWEDLFSGLFELLRVVRSHTPDENTLKAIRRLMRPIEYVIHREMRFSRRPLRHVRQLMLEFEELLAGDIKHKVSSESSTGDPGM
jgi:hypothetical protein